MAKIAIIGAAGAVGAHVVTEALNRGHEVTAVVRQTSQISFSHPRLSVAQADVQHENEVAEKVAGHDIVISTFNAGWNNPHLYEDFISGSKAIEKGTEKAGVKRLLVVGGAGSLYINGHQLVDSPDFPAAYKTGASAARDYLNMLKENKILDWTFLSPAIEMNAHVPGERTGKYRTGNDEPVFDAGGRSHISVQDLAVALLDEAEHPQFIRRRFTVGY
jgi:putative NADH-flavin reductase